MIRSASSSLAEEVMPPRADDLIATRFLEQRRIFLWGPVNDDSARHVIDRLLYLSSFDPNEEITLFIQSPGGANVSGMAILDTMDLISPPVSTVCMGMAASFGALLLCAGAPGRRFAMPNSRIMIHQPHIMGQVEGAAADLLIHAEEIRKDRERINKIIAQRCNKPLADVERDTDRDFWLSAQDAVQYGLVDGLWTKGPVAQGSAGPFPVGGA